MTAEQRWKWAALGLAVVAVASSLHLGLSARRHREILNRKQRDLHHIRMQADRWSREEVYRAERDARREWRPADLDEVATRTLGAGRVRITPRPAAPIADGWFRREAAIEMHDTLLSDAVDFLTAASASTPAWRLTEVDIRSSAATGEGSVTAVLEALEKRARTRAIPWPPSVE